MALMESGKVLESQGKKEEAKSMFKDLVTKFPNSPLATEAKAKVEE
jgi:TolA-binding protein